MDDYTVLIRQRSDTATSGDRATRARGDISTSKVRDAKEIEDVPVPVISATPTSGTLTPCTLKGNYIFWRASCRNPGTPDFLLPRGSFRLVGYETVR